MTASREKRGFLLATAILVGIAQPGSGQPLGSPAVPPDDGDRTIPAILADDISIAFGDAFAYFSTPLTFTKQDRLLTGAAVGGTAWIMSIDEPLNRSIADVSPDLLRKPLEWAEKYGNLRPAQYASAGMYFSGLLLGVDDLRVTGRLLGEGLVLSGLPVIFLQYTLGRGRPESGGGAWKYHFFEWSNGKQSLPSGHTAVAFTISTVIAERYDKLWISIPLYTAAGMSAYSLLRKNQHWTSDVIVGALFGYLGGRYVVWREEERETERYREGTAASRDGQRQGTPEWGVDEGRLRRRSAVPSFEIGLSAVGLTARWYILN